MYPLFETIGIEHGQIKNGHYHELRFKKSFAECFGQEPKYRLFDRINLPKLNSSLTYKLKIKYNETGTCWTITEYLNKIPTSLQVVHDNTIHYSLKYEDRSYLDQLYQKRADADDVLIIKNRCVTDATYSNILFTDGLTIVTPTTPLLKGTCRDRLIAENKIKEIPILLDHLHHFKNFQLVNAMNDFDENRWISMEHIFNS